VTAVHFVVPDGIDDPARPSGGNVYDAHLRDGLISTGRQVHEHAVRGFWSPPDAAPFAALEDVMNRIPDGSVVLIDGLIASTAPEVLLPQASRLRLVALVHMALGADRERAVLAAAASVVTTSEWSRRRLMELYALPRVHVARPGVDPSPHASGSESGEALLCVAAVTPGKGHDVLLDALSGLRDLAWRCVCVGSLTRDPGWAARTLRQARVAGLDDRVEFTGARVGPALAASYAGADALVLATRAESYGMVAAEALARGIPVIGSAVGGLPDTVGQSPDGRVPGLLVPPGDAPALARALRRWLVDDALRPDLRAAARDRRGSLPDWAGTTDRVEAVLAGLLRGVAA
jgi:glycosyltransferase involved in cell wall biosynthesis